MAFSRDINEIIREIIKNYQNQFPTADTSQGSLLFIKAKAFGAALWALYEYIQKASRQIFPDTSETEYLEHHANIWGITRKDNETDSSLLERLMLRIRRPPAGGNKYDYKRWAESVSGVKQAYVFTPDMLPNYILPGAVDVVVLAESGTGYTAEVPSEALLSSVQSVIDENRPVTQYFTNVVSPQNSLFQDGLFEINIDIKIKAGNYDKSRLESSIRTYVNSLAPNETLYNDQITALCIKAGAKDVDVLFSTKVI